MHAHYFFINERNQWNVVEGVTECLKQRNLVPSLDLVEKAVDPSDSLALVIASQNDYLLREPTFQSEK